MILGIDHIVLTVRDIDQAAKFYTCVLGLKRVIYGDYRSALHFGSQKINLHLLGEETRNCAAVGSGDVCLVTNLNLTQVAENLARNHVPIIEGPVTREGARGPMTSVYILDPDKNLIEIARYDDHS